MTDNPRIAELRRRVERDPTSIAFAQLAEEYRRLGDYNEAVKTCRDGLARHPGYLSAQVTLGRALLELGEYAVARKQLEAVLKVAPDNLAAIRALADIHQRHLDVADPPEEPAHAEVAVPAAEQVVEPAAATVTEEHLAPLDTFDALTVGVSEMPDFSDWALETDLALEAPEGTFHDPPADVRHDDPALLELEQWLTAIVVDRSR
jgi:tetratricopeptide (TPR) repeat protein